MTIDENSLTEASDVPEGEPDDETTVDETASAADDTQFDVTTTVDESADDTSASASRRSLWSLIGLRALAVLLVASAVLTVWLYFGQYRPDQQTGPAAQQAVLDAAKSGTVAALSYSPDDLDADLTRAKSNMTGDFLSYYTKFTDEVVRKAVKDKQVSTTAQVMRAAVSEMHPDTAKALVFVNQSTTSSDRPDPSMAASSVLVTMTKIDGTWLISAFDPV